MSKKKTVKKSTKKPAKKKEVKHFDPSWGGSDLPGGGSVFRRFYPNL